MIHPKVFFIRRCMRFFFFFLIFSISTITFVAKE